jgi:hypothetical protein
MKWRRPLILLFLVAMSNGVYAKNDAFFPEDIVKRLKSDLPGFLRSVPTNEGQRQRIEEVISDPEHRKILLFIESPFAAEKISQASQLNNPLLMIEALDILSSNLKLQTLFSDWYLSELVSLVDKKPEMYMLPFLRFCEKSDGAFAEALADPLAEIISNHPGEFSKRLQSIENRIRLCGILETGDSQLVSKSMDKLTDYNKSEKAKAINDLLNCFAHNRNQPANVHPGGMEKR